jgi:monoamine oxidase
MDLKVEDRILLNKIVTNIKWSQDGEKQIRVQCTDGTSYSADHVIVTVSLGVLKHDYKTLFTPELPLTKQFAIEGIAFGTMDKILLEFEEPFWPSEWNGVGMVWTQKDYDQIKDAKNSW